MLKNSSRCAPVTRTVSAPETSSSPPSGSHAGIASAETRFAAPGGADHAGLISERLSRMRAPSRSSPHYRSYPPFARRADGHRATA